MGTGIGDVIRQKAGHDVDLPDDDGRRWQRLPCPFCGKERAAISYEIGIFICHHADCGVKLWWSRHHAGVISRFRLQIEQAVRNTRGKWGKWVRWHDLNQQARLLVIEYACSGLIDDWRYDVRDDENQVDRYMLRELNCDLGNWADKTVRRARAEDKLIENAKVEAGESGRTRKGERYSNAASPGESVEDIAMWSYWPTLKMRFKDGLTNDEIAERLGVSSRTVDRRIADEFADAADTYREK